MTNVYSYFHLFVVAAVGSTCLLTSSGADAESLADRIPTVSKRNMSKANRAEFELSLGYVLNDPFHFDATANLGVGYHFNESMGLRLRGSYFHGFERYPTILVGEPANLPQYNRPVFDGSIELEWSPFYGKWGLLGSAFQSFDTYVLFGTGMISTLDEEVTWEIVGGIGQRLFWNRALVWFWELRGRAFEMQRLPNVTTVQRMQLTATFTLGFMLYLPFEPNYGN